MITPQKESPFLQTAYPQICNLVSNKNMPSIRKHPWLGPHGTQDLADW